MMPLREADLVANSILEECESTNLLAKRLAEASAPHGTWISARRQNAGRGRLGRKWESLEGNLFLSIILRLEHQAKLSWLPLCAAVAIGRVLRAEVPAVDLKIKWPNDLWIGEKKVGGILCEGAAGGGNSLGPYVVVGIGLNTVSAPSEGTDLRFEMNALGLGFAQDLTDRLRLQMIQKLLEEVDALQAQGAASLIRFYEAHTLTPTGSEIEWGLPLQNGTVQGLGQSGELQVLTQQGQVLSLFAEDVRKVRRASYGSRP